MEHTPIEILIADLDKNIEIYESIENTYNNLKVAVLKSIKISAEKLLITEKERDRQMLDKWYKQGYSDARVNLDCNPKQYLKEKPKYFIKPITEEGKRQAIINARNLIVNTKQGDIISNPNESKPGDSLPLKNNGCDWVNDPWLED